MNYNSNFPKNETNLSEIRIDESLLQADEEHHGRQQLHPRIPQHLADAPERRHHPGYVGRLAMGVQVQRVHAHHDQGGSGCAQERVETCQSLRGTKRKRREVLGGKGVVEREGVGGRTSLGAAQPGALHRVEYVVQEGVVLVGGGELFYRCCGAV